MMSTVRDVKTGALSNFKCSNGRTFTIKRRRESVELRICHNMTSAMEVTLIHNPGQPHVHKYTVVVLVRVHEY